MGDDVAKIKSSKYKRGDIVTFEYINANAKFVKIETIRKDIASLNADGLFILNRVYYPKYDSYEIYLVVPCYKTTKKPHIPVNTNSGRLYLVHERLYWIDVASLQPSGIELHDERSKVIANVLSAYDSVHKREQVERRKKRKAEKAEEKQQSVELTSSQRNKLAQKMQHDYELAVISNDRKRMKEIIDILGYAPVWGPNPSRTKSKKYKSFCPKPCSGGRFSPK